MPNPKQKTIGSQSPKLGAKLFKNIEINPKPENCVNEIINLKKAVKPDQSSYANLTLGVKI